MSDTSCRSYVANSLNEYLDIIDFLNDALVSKYKSQRSRPIFRMWYRGHEQHNYVLLPTLLRCSKGAGRGYGRDHLRETLRYQHFRSKCTQLVDTAPESQIEWQEVLQHHLGMTRLMDWSESAISALMFALEAFIDPTENPALEKRRLTLTPTVWVLDPLGLNKHVYEVLQDRTDLISAALQDIMAGSKGVNTLCRRIAGHLRLGQSIYLEDQDEGAMDGIVCLSVIENERRAKGDRMLSLLRNQEFNPFFYLLLRYYSDGLSTPMDTLPPLAIVHPYHSNRIQSQHGVFTVMPHYKIDEEQLNSAVDKRAMERQELIRDCLFRIDITRPAKVAKSLLMLGERRVNLYPELDVYVKDMERGVWTV